MFVTLPLGVIAASAWWERGLATYLRSFDSPDGCLRVDTYRPFWVLPGVFHYWRHFDGSQEGYGFRWESPVFARLHERATDELLGESVVFDSSKNVSGLFWGDPRTVGKRSVSAGGYVIAETARCADAKSLALLQVAYASGQADEGPAYRRRER